MAKKTKGIKFYEAVGRRKEAVARVRLYIVGADKSAIIRKEKNKEPVKIKQGEIYFNNRPIEHYFSTESERLMYLQPLKITGNDNRFAISILAKGGGKRGQLEAVIHGLAKAIEKVDKNEYRPILKEQKFLTRDTRTRERRKVGTGGKARRLKQSPKR